MATYHLATFTADVTPPLGLRMCGSLNSRPAERVDDPLSAQGLVLLGAGAPVVLVALDWCGVCNDAFDRWRRALASAAHTTPERVILTTVHQHDAPITDLEAGRLAVAAGVTEKLFDPEHHEQAIRGSAAALRDSLRNTRPVTHLGLGQGKVEKFASNRRVLGSNGRVVLVRGSGAGKNASAREAPEGVIDPWLKTLSFWDGDQPVAALSCYATHPMSYYNRGGISADTVGIARRRRQGDVAGCAQIHVNGCGGNVTAGKYNDASEASRAVLAERLYQGMKAAWETTQRQPLRQVSFRSLPLRLPVKDSPGFRVEDVRALLEDTKQPLVQRARAAFALSFRKRADAGHRFDVPVLDLGGARLLQLPGEPFVEYQLLAQKLRPDLFVLTLGYGDCGPWYLPTDRAYAEGGYEPGDWSFVAPGVEKALTEVVELALRDEKGRP